MNIKEQIILAAFEDELEKIAGLPRYLEGMAKGEGLRGGARLVRSLPSGSNARDYAEAQIRKKKLGRGGYRISVDPKKNQERRIDLKTAKYTDRTHAEGQFPDRLADRQRKREGGTSGSVADLKGDLRRNIKVMRLSGSKNG